MTDFKDERSEPQSGWVAKDKRSRPNGGVTIFSLLNSILRNLITKKRNFASL